MHSQCKEPWGLVPEPSITPKKRYPQRLLPPLLTPSNFRLALCIHLPCVGISW